MKGSTGLKSPDMTEIGSTNSNKKSHLEANSKLLQNKNKTPKQQNTPYFEEDSVLSHSSRSLFVRNRDNSCQTYQKYLKMLDPSFLKDEDNPVNYKSAIGENSFVPEKIRKLLPLERKKSEANLNELSLKLKEGSRKKIVLNGLALKKSETNSGNNKEKNETNSGNNQEINDETQISSSKNPLKSQELYDM